MLRFSTCHIFPYHGVLNCRPTKTAATLKIAVKAFLLKIACALAVFGSLVTIRSVICSVHHYLPKYCSELASKWVELDAIRQFLLFKVDLLRYLTLPIRPRSCRCTQMTTPKLHPSVRSISHSSHLVIHVLLSKVFACVRYVKIFLALHLGLCIDP